MAFLLRIISLRGWTCLFPKSELALPSFPSGIPQTYVSRLIVLGLFERNTYLIRPNIHNINHIRTAEENLQKDIKPTKANFEANLVHNFAFRNDSKIFKHVGNITKSASTVFFNEKSFTKDSDKATLFNMYFYSVFTQSSFALPQFQDMPLATSTIDPINITKDEVYYVLLSLDPTKATGIDGISPSVLKNYAFVLTRLLCYLFSLVIASLPSGKHIVSSLSLKRAIKILFLIIMVARYHYFVSYLKYLNTLFIAKSLVLFLIEFLPYNLGL